MFVFFKELKRYLTWKKLLRLNKFRSDTWYFVISYGIGDAYIVSALLSEFIKSNGQAILIFEKKVQAFIPNLFNLQLENFEYKPIPTYLVEEFGKFRKGQPIYLHPLKMYDAKLMSIVGLKGTNLVDMYKVLLGLKMTDLPKKPLFPIYTDRFIENLFLQYNLVVGKTIIICPQATSIELLDSNFWSELADKITDNGFKIVFMNYERASGKYQSISFPLQYSKQFCDTAGYIISLRSGFCDLIATSLSKKVILYPDIDYFSGKLFDSTSLYKMGLASLENLLEIVINNQSANTKLTQTILNYINE